MIDLFRSRYRPLSDREQIELSALKDAAQTLANHYESSCPPGRERSLALTKLEESVMWAVKGITG